MIRFEYLLIYSYINKNKQWVVNYLGKELSLEYLSALFCELGSEGWEMITTSTYVEGKIVNTALIPIYATTDVGVSNTSSEIFYFKRILQDNIEYSDKFNMDIQFIKKITAANGLDVSNNLNNVESKINNLEKNYLVEIEFLNKLLANNIIEEIEHKKRATLLKETFVQRKEELLNSTKSVNVIKFLEEEAEAKMEKQKKFLGMNLIGQKEYEIEIDNIKNELAIKIKEFE